MTDTIVSGNGVNPSLQIRFNHISCVEDYTLAMIHDHSELCNLYASIWYKRIHEHIVAVACTQNIVDTHEENNLNMQVILDQCIHEHIVAVACTQNIVDMHEENNFIHYVTKT